MYSNNDYNEEIENKKFKNQEVDYTDAQINEINNELMEISAEDTFYYLVKKYDLYKLLLPALKSKKREMHDLKYLYVTEQDIWNYIKENIIGILYRYKIN